MDQTTSPPVAWERMKINDLERSLRNAQRVIQEQEASRQRWEHRALEAEDKLRKAQRDRTELRGLLQQGHNQIWNDLHERANVAEDGEWRMTQEVRRLEVELERARRRAHRPGDEMRREWARECDKLRNQLHVVTKERDALIKERTHAKAAVPGNKWANTEWTEGPSLKDPRAPYLLGGELMKKMEAASDADYTARWYADTFSYHPTYYCRVS